MPFQQNYLHEITSVTYTQKKVYERVTFEIKIENEYLMIKKHYNINKISYHFTKLVKMKIDIFTNEDVVC